LQFFINIIEYLLSSKKTLVYTAVKQQDYYKIISRLEAVRMKYRVSITTANNSATRGGPHSDLGKVYKIYVKKHDESKALKTINAKSD